ncbi:MAG: hypothetical protein ACW7DW_18825, partial [Paraglaciecola chathamensis]
YSTQANGYFVEYGLRSSFNYSPHVSVAPFVKTAFDYGYASNSHAEHNHSTLGVTAANATIKHTANRRTHDWPQLYCPPSRHAASLILGWAACYISVLTCQTEPIGSSHLVAFLLTRY